MNTEKDPTPENVNQHIKNNVCYTHPQQFIPQYIPQQNFVPNYHMPQFYQPQPPLKVDINCSKCIELQQDVNHLSAQIKIMNKSMELINEQVKLLDMKLSISNSLQKNDNDQKNQNQNQNQNQNRNRNKNKNPNHQKNRPDQGQVFNFLDPQSNKSNLPNKYTPNKNLFGGEINSEPTFIIQFDEIGPGGQIGRAHV